MGGAYLRGRGLRLRRRDLKLRSPWPGDWTEGQLEEQIGIRGRGPGLRQNGLGAGGRRRLHKTLRAAERANLRGWAGLGRRLEA